MSKKILVLEDDEIMNSGLCYNLQKIKMEPFSAYCIEDARKIIIEENIDLILLDVNLPDGDGFRFADEIVRRYSVPFLFLTAHNLEKEIIQGLKMGADDYITKPFSIKVVMEKIQTVLRRCSNVKEVENYACGNLNIDFKNRIVIKSGEIVSLTPTEYEILQFFCMNREQILTKEVLLQHVWDNKGNYVNEHTLALNISRLRNKIADESFDYIKTIYGLGYKWIGEE